MNRRWEEVAIRYLAGFAPLPPRPLSPPDRAEDHEYERCEWCGELVTEDGCRCAEIERKIEEAVDE